MGEPRKRSKPRYRVSNARHYNESLRRRGMISLYVPGGDLETLFINATPHVRGVSGRERTYTDAYVELIFTFYRLFGWGMRQITGYMQDYWASRGLDIAVPSFGQLSERLAALKLQVTQRCETVARRLARGESVSLIVDSTGLSFARASQWHEEKYGRRPERKPWRKLHLAIDAQMNIHGVAVTGTDVSDSEGMDRLMAAADVPVERVIADGAYYSIERGETLSQAGIVPVIPPPANAVVHDRDDTGWHDQIVGYIKDKGIHAFQKKYGYGLRALVEAQISRIKRCIGERLLTRRTASQKNEGVVIANLVNQWNAFGRCVCVKNG